MEQYNLKNSNFRQLANSILETFWSIVPIALLLILLIFFMLPLRLLLFVKRLMFLKIILQKL